jgi:FAD:protein FMN transferase
VIARDSWPTMGSMASLVVSGIGGDPADRSSWRRAAADVRAWFERVEAVLSPYRTDSDLVRWRTGQARLTDCSPLLAEVIAEVEPLPLLTDGGFHPYDKQGRYDPTGYVKGWAIQRGGDLLAERGIDHACLGIGGDLQTLGRARPDRPWQLAVVDPLDGLRPAAMVRAAEPRFAIATSGTYQRGDHIWTLPGPAPARRPVAEHPLGSITVVGPGLAMADTFATAIWSSATRRTLAEAWAWLPDGYHALAITRDRRLIRTPGMGQYLVTGAPGPPLPPAGRSAPRPRPHDDRAD